MIRLVVVGYGSAGARHAENARASGCYVEVTDVAEARRDKARQDGFALYAGGDPDAVVVAAPADQHLRVIAEWQVRQPDIPVLVEKPLAASAEGVAHIRASHVHVAYNWRFHPDVVAWRASWPDVPDRLELTCLTRMREWPGERYGSPLLECSHELDLLLWLRRPVVPRLVSAWHLSAPASARFMFTTGDVVTVQWESPQPPARRYEARMRHHCHVIEPRMGSVLARSYRAEMAAFVAVAERVVRQSPASLASVGDALWVIETCEAAARMLR